ncbi:OmpP1/FadL family transporter [Tateyamaria sp. SN6-1]|uniref:OmpP1/FadL family transporter n=1 Tax=Tateyamaria sp. SN6-1 TaxID=3092148 RepID=UPI0039F5D388
MKTRALAAAAVAASAVTAQAGGIDRSSQFISPIFEEGGETGSYVQFGLGRIMPSAEASNLSVANPLGDYNALSFAYKTDLTEKLSVALIIEEPYGADIQYPLVSPFAGGGASVSSEQISAIARYKFNDNWSVIGGIRALQVDGSIDTFTAAPVPGGLAPVSIQADSDWAFSGVVGVAYEIPDIALRVALTYNSEASADFDGTESVFTDATRSVAAGSGATSFTVDFPESINLEFQTGIAEDTLLFGSIRRSLYDGFNLTTPANTALLGGAIGSINYVNFANDTTTYSLGVGRRFNEQWSGSISFTYESAGVTPSTTALAPTTGTSAVAIGAQYKMDAMTISGGISYIVPGDQLVNSSVGQADFNDNDAIAVGLRIGYNF